MDFALAWHDRRAQSMHTPRRFLDFLAGGESLYERHGADFISPLGWLSPVDDERAALRLLRKEPPDVENRVALYVCPEDADLYCGAITAEISREGDTIAWKDLALTTFDSQEGIWRHDTATFQEWPELRFAARIYYDVIADRPRPASA